MSEDKTLGLAPTEVPPAPAVPTLSEPTASQQSLRRLWDGGVTFAHDVGEWAKLGTLLLALGGLVGVLVPDVKRWWEVHLGAEDWYYIGLVKDGRFVPFAYQHPYWNDGPAPVAVLDKLSGSVIVTMKDDLHIGRNIAGAEGRVRTVAPDGACLNVREVKRLTVAGNPVQYVWAGAVKVTC